MDFCAALPGGGLIAVMGRPWVTGLSRCESVAGMFRIVKVDDIAQCGADSLGIGIGVAIKAQIDRHAIAARGHRPE